MTKLEFDNIKFNDLCYNEDLKFVGKVLSYRSNKEDDTIREYVWLDKFDGFGHNGISADENDKLHYSNWHLITDDSPDWVRLNILQKRFFDLESFVYSRLH